MWAKDTFRNAGQLVRVESDKELLPCPHCGKPPSLFVARTEGEGFDDGLDIFWIRAIRLGATYCRIECCTIMEGINWEKMRKTWNSRVGASETVHVDTGNSV